MTTAADRARMTREEYTHHLRVRPRPFLTQLHRGGKVLWSRHFTALHRAIPRGIQLAMIDNAQPKDVIEVSDSRTGKQVAVIRVSTTEYKVEVVK